MQSLKHHHHSSTTIVNLSPATATINLSLLAATIDHHHHRIFFLASLPSPDICLRGMLHGSIPMNFTQLDCHYHLFYEIEQKSGGRKNPATRPLGMIVKVKPQPKKAKINELSVEKHSEVKNTDIDSEKSPEPVKTSNIGDTNKADDVSKIGLVSYSDESEDDD
ncbi:hypothetical protein LWI28_023428 [Acer negundo]|uniref:Uncharacterized protein n=1 Tax=Acer negundo TaxID=4023 RepID=A0AAD5NTX8_ACENE|nr:hypothetical protein LWI28_023428 [Acer negundo]